MFDVLDVEMDKWAKSIPEHREFHHSCRLDQFLDIDAVRETSFESSADHEFVRQSVYLHAHYHKFNMWIRRPCTLPNRKDSPLAPAATAMCTGSAVTCFHLLYKLRHQLSVDLIHYEVSSQVFGPRIPGTDELELSGCNICGGLHLPHQCVESAPLRRYHPRQRVTREVFGAFWDYGKEVPHSEYTLVRPSAPWTYQCLLVH